ncbi:adenylyltransferase/cytidyltransferase family protein [Candidatus Nitrosotalea okcheonensis]|uniref:Cytidyltransferase-related domain n=1 Tax=Candidatus Nitrosotalea okcheonensis TaxID=1903276 RepID=A0A2H1FFN0_9ARCH|nr:adenylyltransferase/cytidyltransferase family protein [Candidatus Nitrosotalea okcheonensis]SMH71554.1 Cytidyltransferase-related domain [Candidatus Nitrosotalea okcheonensis]
MDAFDKEIITAFFVASLSGDTATDIIRKKISLSPEYIQEKIDYLVKNGFIENNKKTLTEFGRNSIRVVLAGGVFDIIHPGHIHTLRAAKALGNVLVVVIATDKTAQKMKNRIPLHNMELRKDLVRSLSMVDYAVVGYEGNIFKSVEIIKPNIIALGYDQVHQEKFIIDGCKKIGIDVSIARLQSPIPDIKSSKIENDYGKSIYGI